MSSPLSRRDSWLLSRHARDKTTCEPQERHVQLDQALAFFTRARPRLLGIAYRIVGNAADAEDIVQDVWLRWQRCDRAAVEAPAAFLATTTTRLAINAIQSAHARHETCFDSQHSSQSDMGADPALGAEQREALRSAVLLLLERLSPAERAAYVLREAFEYPYQHVAALIEATEATTRQLVSRARRRLASERRKPVKVPECTQLFTALLAAAESGNLAALEQALTADVIRYAHRVRIAHMSRRSEIDHEAVVKFRRRSARQPGQASKQRGPSNVAGYPLVSPGAA
jgi:RNA polymerase sigma factor (sigma-70 family)